MNRCIPGTEEVTGREFIYIESPADEDFQQLITSVFANVADVELPTTGGVVEERARIFLEKDRSLLGISYKGDIDGWRAKLIKFCGESGRVYGFIKEYRLVLSNGASPLLEELSVQLV